jgi:hypothetical protein
LFNNAIEGFDMFDFSKSVAGFLCTGAIFLLAACATPIEEPPTLVELTQEEARAEAASTITGSRIPRKSTERLVKQTDAAGAKEMSRSRAPEPLPFVK